MARLGLKIYILKQTNKQKKNEKKPNASIESFIYRINCYLKMVRMRWVLMVYLASLLKGTNIFLPCGNNVLTIIAMEGGEAETRIEI